MTIYDDLVKAGFKDTLDKIEEATKISDFSDIEKLGMTFDVEKLKMTFEELPYLLHDLAEFFIDLSTSVNKSDCAACVLFYIAIKGLRGASMMVKSNLSNQSAIVEGNLCFVKDILEDIAIFLSIIKSIKSLMEEAR